MAISIDKDKIFLYPIESADAYIRIDNNSGLIKFAFYGEDVTLDQIDRIIEDLSLAKKISKNINNS